MFYYSYRTASDFLQEIGKIYGIIGQVVLQCTLVAEFHQETAHDVRTSPCLTIITKLGAVCARRAFGIDLLLHDIKTLGPFQFCPERFTLLILLH